MQANATEILDSKSIHQKIRRIAFEIYENNIEEDQLFLIGIGERGEAFAKALQKQLGEIATFESKLYRIDLDKESPDASNIQVNFVAHELNNQVVVLIDDVLNTGKTAFYALIPLIEAKPKKLETAFLVNRSHKSFPLAANYTGLELSTTLHNHIKVDFENEIVTLVNQ